MDRYGQTEGSKSDPSTEWSVHGGETGLEEPMWQLGLGSAKAGAVGGGGSSGGVGEAYPERPEQADCIYYLKTGFCGFGSRCRFNHPPDRAAVLAAGRHLGAAGGGDSRDYPERVGQPVCQYFMRTGTCKFGSSCKYHHPRQGAGSVSPMPNIYGYPLRPGEKECSYYMKTGQCKFGVTCKFHHPNPANIQVPAANPAPAALPPAPMPPPAIYPPVQSPAPPSSQQYGVVPAPWQVPRPPMVPGSYIQGPYGSMLVSPGMMPLPGWTTYPPPSPGASPTAQSSVAPSQLYGMPALPPPHPGAYQSQSSLAALPSGGQKEQTFPERPGQPECQYYLKTGDCKFGSSCRYHHPADWTAPKTTSALSPMGLPLRPGAQMCSYYAQHGVCKFGPTCKFDHPMGTLSYSPSASSLSDMPVAPYLVGVSIGTLAPSSSSSDLRNEAVSGPNKDSPTRMSSSASAASGSILSKSGATQSSIQQSSQSSSQPAGSSSSSSNVQGGAGTHSSS